MNEIKADFIGLTFGDKKEVQVARIIVSKADGKTVVDVDGDRKALVEGTAVVLERFTNGRSRLWVLFNLWRVMRRIRKLGAFASDNIEEKEGNENGDN